MAEIVSPFHPSSADAGNGSGPKASAPPGRTDLSDAPEPAATLLRLIRPIGDAVWLADADGGLVTARPVPGTAGPGAGESWTSNALGAWGGNGHPHVLTPRGTASLDGATWLISDYTGGVRLDRLVTAAVLTPLQAAYAAADVFSGLAELHAAGLVHGRMSGASAVLGADGVVRLTDLIAVIPADADKREALREGDVRHARALVAELARNADRPGVRRRPDAVRLLTGLVTLAASPDWTQAGAASARLTGLLVEGTAAELLETDVRKELAALAAAADRVDARTPAHTDRPPGTKTAPDRPGIVPAGSLSAADWRPRRRRWVWIVAVVVAAAIAATAVFARGPVTSLVDRLLHRNSAPSTSSSSSGPQMPRKVPTFAPAKAGPIRAVTVHRLAPCRPGHACRIRVTVRMRPASGARSVQLTVRLVHRCSTLPPYQHALGVLRVRPHARSAETTRRIAVPPGRSLAIVVMTTTPARAAARPVLAPAHVSRC